MNRFFSIFFLLAILQCVVSGLSFNECTSEEQAMQWLREKIEANEKIDKNIISIVLLSCWFSFLGYTAFLVECC